jgi:hypothetical protein
VASYPRKKPRDALNPNSAWIPTRPDPRGAAPALLGEVLVGAEDILSRRSGAAMPRSEWTRIVGPRIAARTRVGGLRRGTLTIKVASSAWSNELSFLKPSLIAKLVQAGHDISDIRFTVDNIAGAPPARPAHPGARPEASAPLPPELLARLERVEDPNLRAAIAAAARASLEQKK